MARIHSVAVFCGSHMGDDPVFRAAATGLGQALAGEGMRLVYGGGRVGLMGAVADGAVAAGGTVIGVIPEFLRRAEVAHEGLSELIVTEDMHTRKRRMFELSDAFVSFPGGLGTLDETFEILTWRQLRLHDKPIVICDINRSAGPLLALMEAVIGAGFARPDVREYYAVTRGIAETMELLRRTAAREGGRTALL